MWTQSVYALQSTHVARGAYTIHHMTTSFAARVQDQDKTMQRVRAARESPHGNLGSAPAKTRKLPDDHGIGIGMARPRSRTATYAKAKSPSVTSMHLARRHAAAAPSGPGPGTNHPPVDPSVLSPTVFVERSTAPAAMPMPLPAASASPPTIVVPSSERDATGHGAGRRRLVHACCGATEQTTTDTANLPIEGLAK